MIGSIAGQAPAERFVDYLLTLGIVAQAEEQTSGGWTIWVEDDDHLERAQRELEQFNGNPDDPRYSAGRAAQRLRAEQEKREQRLRKRHVDVRTRWHIAGQGAVPLTLVLIGACLLVAVLTNLGGRSEPVRNWLLFASPDGWFGGTVAGHMRDWDPEAADSGEAAGENSQPPEADSAAIESDEAVEEEDDFLAWPAGGEQQRTALRDALQWRWDGLIEIRSGQLWRLVTPMLLHFGVLHLIFNLYWLYNFGGAIESRKGWMKLLAMILGISLAANLVQYGWAGSPFFGGMSGVVYGLFGYLWVKSVLQPQEQFVMPQQTVIILVAWLFICMTGMLGPIANAAHVAGLVAGAGLAGAAWSTVQARRWWRTRGFEPSL